MIFPLISSLVSFRFLLCIILFLWIVLIAQRSFAGAKDGNCRVPILVYHRFGPTVADEMTVRTSTFKSQLDYLLSHGFHPVRLREVVDYVRGRGSVPVGAFAITVDDGHRTVFSQMRPLVEERRIPVTLFIYPSAISNASYTMTWDQLKALHDTGLFDIQSHTYWHPNFKRERKRLHPAEFLELVNNQLSRSRAILKLRLDQPDIDMVAWPFGIYDDQLGEAARQLGYIAGFTIERRAAARGDNAMALPRFLITDDLRGAAFERFMRQFAPTS